ncbi:MAG: hypothetical protein AAGG53_00220 [Cyanobacteria bacterium P01_H01_bin.152]
MASSPTPMTGLNNQEQAACPQSQRPDSSLDAATLKIQLRVSITVPPPIAILIISVGFNIAIGNEIRPTIFSGTTTWPAG